MPDKLSPPQYIPNGKIFVRDEEENPFPDDGLNGHLVAFHDVDRIYRGYGAPFLRFGSFCRNWVVSL